MVDSSEEYRVESQHQNISETDNDKISFSKSDRLLGAAHGKLSALQVVLATKCNLLYPIPDA
jgi:hypothetical protein